MRPVWVEIHVDDEVLSAQPDRWPEAARLIASLSEQAQARGAALCFRFREHFAAAAAGTQVLLNLQAAGHEIGVHAHGSRLAEATLAVRRCGVTPQVAVPGLVQVGRAGRSALLRQAAGLGFARVTDHSAERAWAYDGLLPRAESGVVVMAPTIRPFDWGLMETDGTRHRLRSQQIDRLRVLEAAAEAQGAAWFGFALHEHDLCHPGTLTPDPEAIAALLDYLDDRVVAALSIPVDVAAPPPAQRPPPSDRRIKMVRAVGLVSGRARRLRRRLPDRPRRRPPEGQRLTIGSRHIVAERLGPAAPRALCVLSHAGREGGRRLRFKPTGPILPMLLEAGWGVWLYDRAGTGDSPPPRRIPGWRGEHPLAPGHPAHTRDWRTVLARARQDGVPVIAMSWSAGVVPVLRAAAAGDRPDALVDCEGPADRWSIVPPGGNELAGLDPWEEADWNGWEPRAQIGALGVPYARLQADRDHIHDRDLQHAVRLTAAAQAGDHRVRPLSILPGRLHASPDAVVAALEWALAAATGRR